MEKMAAQAQQLVQQFWLDCCQGQWESVAQRLDAESCVLIGLSGQAVYENLPNLLDALCALSPLLPNGEMWRRVQPLSADLCVVYGALMGAAVGEGLRYSVCCRVREGTPAICHIHLSCSLPAARATRPAAPEFSALTDPLTGLYNRRHFEQQVRLALGERQAGAFYMIDLDHFKHINDSLGHPQGDVVLTAFAKILRRCFGARDILGRTGGDEFAVFQRGAQPPEVAAAQAASLIAQLQAYLARLSALPQQACCVGIALAPEQGRDFDHLYQRADRALYAAKVRGRATYRLFQAR